MSASAPVREHLAAARAGAAICARDELAFVRVSGRDAARLLQNVVTSDIDALAVGEGQYGLALTPKGRPLADAWIVREGDDAFVCACESVGAGRPRGRCCGATGWPRGPRSLRSRAS